MAYGWIARKPDAQSRPISMRYFSRYLSVTASWLNRALKEREPGCDVEWIMGVLGSRKITARSIHAELTDRAIWRNTHT